MKTKLVILLITVLPIIFIGCQKSEVSEDFITRQTPNGELKIEAELCGEAMPFDFKNYGAAYIAGTGEIGNDEEKLYLSIKAPEGYTIRHYLGYIGSVEHFISSGAGSDLSNGEAHVEPQYFNIPKVTLTGGETYVELEFLLADLPQPQPGDCFLVAFVGNFTSNGEDTQWGWATYSSSQKSDSYYMYYCPEECEEPELECETVFAYNPNEPNGICFSEFNKKTGNYNPNGPANKNFSRWGWTNEISQGSYDFEVWAGAGQCNFSKGTLVGNLHIEYSGTTATVTYDMFNGFVLDETHLYIGDEPIPTGNNGKATVAPGQYPYSDGDATTVEDNLVVYEINNLPDDGIWVVAHGVACGEYDD